MPRANTQAYIPQRELRQFNSLLDELEKKTKLSSMTLVKRASRTFCTTNRNAAPKSKKKRKIVSNKQYDKKAARKEEHTDQDLYSDALTKKYKYRMYTQKSEPWWEYTNERSAKNVPGTKIKYEGALRNVWQKMAGEAMGKPKKAQYASKNARGWRKAGQTERNLRGNNPNVVLTNRLQYVNTVTPRASEIGLDGAYKDVQQQYDRLIGNLRQSWRR